MIAENKLKKAEDFLVDWLLGERTKLKQLNLDENMARCAGFQAVFFFQVKFGISERKAREIAVLLEQMTLERLSWDGLAFTLKKPELYEAKE